MKAFKVCPQRSHHFWYTAPFCGNGRIFCSISFNQILAECPRVPCVFFSTNLFSKSLKFYSLRPIHAESSDNSVPPTYRYHTVSLNLSSLCAAISVIYKIPEILIAFSMEIADWSILEKSIGTSDQWWFSRWKIPREVAFQLQLETRVFYVVTPKNPQNRASKVENRRAVKYSCIISMNFCQRISGSFPILYQRYPYFVPFKSGFFSAQKPEPESPPGPKTFGWMLGISFGGGFHPQKKNGIDGFFSRFLFFFWGGGVKSVLKKKLSNPSKAPFMAFGPSTSRSWSNNPRWIQQKMWAVGSFAKHFTSDYVKFSFHTAGGRGLWWHCVSFRSVFHVSKSSPNCSGSSWTPTIPSTRRLPLSRCSRANTARQSRPSLL